MVILEKLIGYIVFVDKLSRFYRLVVSVVCITIAMLISVMTYQITVKADSVSWVAGGDLKLVGNHERSINLQPQHCREQQIQIGDRSGFIYLDQSGFTNACVYDMDDWRYALTNRTYRDTYFNRNDTGFALSIGLDKKMYRVNNLHPQNIPIYVPSSKSLVYASEGYGWGRKLKIYADIVKRLVKVDANTYAVRDVESPDFTFKRPNGDLLAVGKAVSSDNGKWLVFEAVDFGIMRLNLDTYEIKRVSSVAPQYGLGATPHMSMAISNDGEYLAIAGENTPFNIYHVTPNCGDNTITNEMTKDTLMPRPCAVREIGQHLEGILPSGLAAATSIRLSADSGEIGFVARLNNDRYGQNQKEYIVQAPGYSPIDQLEYLAMGDSFSSGEGDTQVFHGSKFYLSGTDVEGDSLTPREKCHIGSRSYPFLLKNAMGMADKNMKSVACSGAELRKDYSMTNDYRGQDYQGSPRLSVLLPDKLKSYQDRAQDSFVPGRVQQLEFIDKYKPQSITITGGGNDVGFGQVIQSCILSTYYSCNYNNTQQGRAAIGQGIANQRHTLSTLFTKIRSLSPNTKIYMVGYPQFVDSSSFFCAPNVPISQAERVMIVEAVSYLNRVIESAATSSGVKYIDIENSLAGHKLCEKGAAYVTGLSLARKLGLNSSVFGKSEEQESFHPNRNGHILIAKKIRQELESQSLLNYSKYPVSSDSPYLTASVEPPAYFATAMANARTHYLRGEVTLRDYIKKVPLLDVINVRFGNFEPNSQVAVEIHSDPTALGTYTVDDEGFLSADILLPNGVAAGFHTLHIIGKSYSGESIDVRQGIEVQGADGDVDEDGISDDVDGCTYVTESKIDMDNDDIDDACDPMIEEVDREQTDIALLAIETDLRKDVKQEKIDDVDQSLQGIVSTQDQVAKLFDQPIHVDNRRSSSINSGINIFYVVFGIIVSGLILNWAIKRYSNHNSI